MTEVATRPISEPHRPPPAGACDTHFHVIGPHARFPLANFLSYDPPLATLETNLAMLDKVGISRGVIVQPASIYGLDNSAMLDAVARSGGKLRGIGVVDASVSESALEEMAGQGVKGLRFVEVRDAQGGKFPGSMGFDQLGVLAPRMRALGLQAQIWADCADILANAAFLKSLGLTIVLDHMGRFDTAAGVSAAGFQTLIGLLSRGDVWIKLSLCRASQKYPDYADLRPFHDALVRANPDRLLWGSDWPHLRMGASTPDVGHLVDLFDAWIGDDALRTKIMATNPAALFGFGTDA